MTALPYLRTRPRLALLVLPALLLRALIPVGFMPVADAHGASLGLCPGMGVMRHAGHGSHTVPHDPRPGSLPDQSAAHHTPCLFSAGASTGFVATHPGPAPAAEALTVPGDRPRAQRFIPAILRAQSPRAPPLPA